MERFGSGDQQVGRFRQKLRRSPAEVSPERTMTESGSIGLPNLCEVSRIPAKGRERLRSMSALSALRGER